MSMMECRKWWKLILVWSLMGIMTLNLFLGTMSVSAKAEPWEEELYLLDEYFPEAKQALSELVAQREIWAVVYLCMEYRMTDAPGGEVTALLPSGQQVQILDASMDSLGRVWLKVSTLLGEQEQIGYIERQNIACSDERFLDWEMQYGMVTMQAMLLDLDTETEELEENPVPLDVQLFPESYQPALMELKKLHQNWMFVPMYTGLDWNTVITAELQGGKSLVHKSLPDCTKEGAYDQGNWFYASREVLERYMDPRNSLTESTVFQFEQLTYNESYHTLEAMEAFLEKTFMNSSKNAPGTEMTFAFIFWAVGKEEGRKVSPFHLAARVYQEQGSGTSPLISGVYPGYEGYYNYFNVGATGTTNQQVIQNGLRYAKNAKPPWTSAYYSILGGADVISANYIKRGQYTLYLQKYNVNRMASSALYTHQYMQNISAPTTEASSIKRLYESAGALNSPFTFVIPVYDNMPEQACEMPSASTNVLLNIPGGYTGSTVYLDGVAYTAERRNGRIIVKAPDNKAKLAEIVATDTAGATTRYLWDLNYKNTYYEAVPWTIQPAEKDIILEVPEGFKAEEIWLDGCPVQTTGYQNKILVPAANTDVSTAVAYAYTQAGVPVDMMVWTLDYQDHHYQATQQPGLKGLLSYHGFSIRITGKSGIRYKSGISTVTREALLGEEGINGYRLKEYGTLVMSNANRGEYPMIKGGEKVAIGMTYGIQEDGSTVDTIYETVDERYRFTGVLVGLPVAQYKTEFAFRGYAVLEKDGKEIVVYSCPVARSIYALSQQVLGLGMYENGSDADVFLRQLISDADALEAPQS